MSERRESNDQNNQKDRSTNPHHEQRKSALPPTPAVSLDTERLENSLSAQISYYSAFIQRNPSWEYAGVFADNGISGTSTDRTEFQRLMAECEAGHIDIILTKSISRFARNTLDTLTAVRRLRELGIEVQFEKEHIHTLSDKGELLLTLLASFCTGGKPLHQRKCQMGRSQEDEEGNSKRTLSNSGLSLAG